MARHSCGLVELRSLEPWGTLHLLRVAEGSKPVYVNGQMASRKGEYFCRKLSVNNAGGPVWLGVTVTSPGEATVTGNLFVPRTPEVFTHDLDGNLTSDGRWTYTWDAENQLLRVQSRSDTPQGSWRRVEWQYDALGRRIRQTTSTWLMQSNLWVVTEDLKFLSDPLLFGRHLVDLNASNNVAVRTYVWGLDLSETMDGAGGVGGLLWMTLHTGSGPAAGTHFAAYDGNGNVVALSAASDRSETARYEYGPFGEPIRVTGHAATLNAFPFSTKRTCNTTDLVLYEYRTYSPSLGRWRNRDPIGELGFKTRLKTLRRKCTRGFASAGNLYGFVGNNPLNSFDVFGLYEYEWEGRFTEAEKQAIKDSIHRVRERANALIKQIDDNIKSLKRCPCPAYDELAKKLEGLKKVLQGIVKEIDDPGWNLEIYKKYMPGRDAEYWNSPVPWLDDELRLNPSWFGQGTIDQDTTMFHEITHGQGTVDDDFSNPYNNAHALEGLMHTDKENWIYFTFDKQDADKKCNPAGK